MLGTFHPGDYLTIEPVPINSIRPGDVVIYRGVNHEGEPGEVVHRVVVAVPGGLLTRGDNNPYADEILVTADNLLGRVTHVERGGKTQPVRGGRWGLLRVRVLHAWRGVRWRGRRLVAFVGRWPYRWLRNSSLVPRLWRPAVTKIRLATENGPLVKYVSGQRTVARWWPATGRFHCCKPYDLVIPRPNRAFVIPSEEREALLVEESLGSRRQDFSTPGHYGPSARNDGQQA
jgi:signal peptidase I